MIKQKLEYYLAENTDRFNCRYLCKRNPELWKLIMDATSFLPDDAKPKQRCWHVENGIFQIPKCPVTNKDTKWFENRYLTYDSLSAKSSCPIVQKKCLDTFKKNSGHNGHWSSSPKIRKQIFEKRVKNPQKGFTRSKEWHEKIRKTWDKKLMVHRRGQHVDSYKSYRRIVEEISDRNYKHNRSLIENGDAIRGPFDNHLDHVFSIWNGWRLGIPPFIIGHYTNLRMISYSENCKKSYNNHKTIDQLYCDIIDAICQDTEK